MGADLNAGNIVSPRNIYVPVLGNEDYLTVQHNYIIKANNRAYTGECIKYPEEFNKIILFTRDYSLKSRYAVTDFDRTDGILIDSILYCIGKYHAFFVYVNPENYFYHFNKFQRIHICILFIGDSRIASSVFYIITYYFWVIKICNLFIL